MTKYDDLSYTYDAGGNRVSAGDTKFIYDDNGHLLSDGVNTYVYGASGVVGYYNKDGKFVTYLFNQRGDVVKETDESGSVANSFDYNDYGKLTSSDHVVGSVFGYGGQYGAVTDKNGLIFLRTRYYNPEIMCFMNRDTVRGSVVDTKSLNRFSYVEGNPLTYVDPNGEAATWLKNNGLNVLMSVTLTGLSIAFPEVGIAMSAINIMLDVSRGDYFGIVSDSLGLITPFARGLKFEDILTSPKAIGGAIGSFSRNLRTVSQPQPQPAFAGMPTDMAPNRFYASVSSGSGSSSVPANTSGTISSLDDLANFDKSILKSGKPKYSPVVKKWINNGGKVNIDKDGMWTYTNRDGVSVSYPNGDVDFKKSGYVDYEHDIGPFKDRNKEIREANKNYPEEALGHTWHHSAQQNGILQAVPSDIHSQFTHRGGISKFVLK